VKGQVRRARPRACGRQARNIIRGAPPRNSTLVPNGTGGRGGGLGK
jgi:hypothetical protein